MDGGAPTAIAAMAIFLWIASIAITSDRKSASNALEAIESSLLIGKFKNRIIPRKIGGTQHGFLLRGLVILTLVLSSLLLLVRIDHPQYGNFEQTLN